MLQIRSLAVFLSLVAGVAGTFGNAQTIGQPEEFTAVGIMNTNIGSGADRIIIRAERWSTEAERAKLADAFKKGNDAALEVLRELRPVGIIRTPDTLGYDLRYAHQEPSEEGGRRVVFATDRPISFWEAREQPRTIDYPFTVIQIEMDRNGEGKGTMSMMTKVIPRGNIIILEDFASAPVMLREVRSKPITP